MAVFGTREWASHSFNIQFGCENNCKYCYARSMSVRHKKRTPANWKEPISRPNAINHTMRKREGTIMFPTTHGITPLNINDCLDAMLKMLQVGNKLLVVTKPHLECVKRILEACSGYKDSILFRFTIGSANDEVLKFWEPGAPGFYERQYSLVNAHHAGFQTSVSCEPMLDNMIDDVVRGVESFVTDSIWLGKANFLRQRLSINGELDEETEERARQLLEWQNDERILELYQRHRNNPKVKWKESIKKVVGLEIPEEVGLDV